MQLGFADAAFAAGNGEKILDAGNTTHLSFFLRSTYWASLRYVAWASRCEGQRKLGRSDRDAGGQGGSWLERDKKCE